MAGVIIESNDTLESLLKAFSAPAYDLDGFPNGDKKHVIDSAIAFDVADDIIVAGDVPPAFEVDSLAAEEAPTSRRSKVNKISKLDASKSGAGATHADLGLAQDRAQSLAFDQDSSLRRSSKNKISGVVACTSVAADSVQDESLDICQRSSSRPSKANKIPLHVASTSDVTDVVASTSDVTDVAASTSGVYDVHADQFTHGYNPHVQDLQSHECYMAYIHGNYVGSASMTSQSNVHLPVSPMHFSGAPDSYATQRTTLVLRNIPKTYNTSSVVKLLDYVGYKGMFDFVDVPTNRVSRTTGGFAIVNLIHPAYAPFFWKSFDGFNQWTCKSRNICRVVWYEQLQGLQQIVSRYKNLIVERKDLPKKARPWLLNEGEWVPF